MNHDAMVFVCHPNPVSFHRPNLIGTMIRLLLIAAAFPMGFAMADPSGTLVRGPYLNMANHNSIVIRWRSSEMVAGRVSFGPSPDQLVSNVDENVARLDHVVRLTGLSPYTRYYYSVGSAGDSLTPEISETTKFSPEAPAPTAADYTFRTSPLPGTATDTRVWIMGDSGKGTQDQANARDSYRNYTGSRIPDLNLQLGDNAYDSGTDAEYQTNYFNMYANVFRKMPQWSTLGNHDTNQNPDPLANHPYFDMFSFPAAGECGGVASGTEHYYGFDYGNIHFICLDSQASDLRVDDPGTPSINEDGPMAAWLRLDLANTTATWIVAFWHHPPYTKGSHDSDTETQLIDMRIRFNPILEQGGVDIVFCGHSHNYERSVLLDGHYGTSGTLTPPMRKNSGNGSVQGLTTTAAGIIRRAPDFIAVATTGGSGISGDGTYIKPLTGPRDHFGAVYITAGMSGASGVEPINHPAMYISYNTMGSVNLDVNGTILKGTFIQAGGATPDNFTITKQGAADTDHDGIPDAYEIAYGLNRHIDDSAADPDFDTLSNFIEFAFGLAPHTSDAGPLEADVPGHLLNKRGVPATWYQIPGGDAAFRVIYIRRKDAAEAGVVYAPQFSGDLESWTTSAVTPTVIADSGEVEAVSLDFPLFSPGQSAMFFRLKIGKAAN